MGGWAIEWWKECDYRIGFRVLRWKYASKSLKGPYFSDAARNDILIITNIMSFLWHVQNKYLNWTWRMTKAWVKWRCFYCICYVVSNSNGKIVRVNAVLCKVQNICHLTILKWFKMSYKMKMRSTRKKKNWPNYWSVAWLDETVNWMIIKVQDQSF